jgi:hypothetical protein
MVTTVVAGLLGALIVIVIGLKPSPEPAPIRVRADDARSRRAVRRPRQGL